jgi:DDE superfamily endonuclease
MLSLPPEFLTLLMPFAPLFSEPVFHRALTLLAGAILTPGRRTVAGALRVLGRQHTPHFQNFHRVLNRARWSTQKAARLLLLALVRVFAPDGVVLMGIDETLERRQGEQIAARGAGTLWVRDAARSSRAYLNKAGGLRWVCLMLLAWVPWANRVWALPFLSVLAPSERYHQERGLRHKTLSDWARQMIAQVRRWLPDRLLVVVADSTYAVLTLLSACQQLRPAVILITRLRLDAALYEPAPPRAPGQVGRPRVKGKRLPTLEQVLANSKTRWKRVRVPRWYSQGEREVEIVTDTGVWYHTGLPVVPIRWVLIRDPQGKFAPQALLCTDQMIEPVQLLSWFVLRWQLETTFQEVRAHLGVETQRQWNDLAIQRTTPVLLGLFSLVTLLADQQAAAGSLVVRQAAWYRKATPTFSDALAAVRRQMWRYTYSCSSPEKGEGQKPAAAWLECVTETLCYAA